MCIFAFVYRCIQIQIVYRSISYYNICSSNCETFAEYSKPGLPFVSMLFHFSLLLFLIVLCKPVAEILTEFWDAVCKNNHKTVFAQGQTTGSKKLQTEDTSYKQMVCFQCFKLTLALSHAEFITATM